MYNPKPHALTFLMACGFFICAATASAQQKISISSGTGFFVSQQGYVITNNHVVKSCKSITVRGDMPETAATLVATDSSNDLALLKTGVVPGYVANLRSDDSDLAKGAKAMIIGYPREHGMGGAYVVKDTSIVGVNGPLGQTQWIQFADAADQGNSGGPLLDDSGNVVGVVVGKSKLTVYNTIGARNEVVQESDIAIALPVLKKFLEENSVYFRTADSGINLMSSRIEQNAKLFTLNIHCVQ